MLNKEELAIWDRNGYLDIDKTDCE